MGVTAGTCPEGRPVPSTWSCRAPPSPVLLKCSSGLQRRQASSGQPGRIDWRVDGLTGSHRIDWWSWPRARSACRPPCERAASRQPRPVRARPSRRPGCRHATRRNRQSPTRLDPSGRPNRRGTTRRPLAAVPGRSSSTWAPVTTACRPGGRCALAAPQNRGDLREGNSSGRPKAGQPDHSRFAPTPRPPAHARPAPGTRPAACLYPRPRAQTRGTRTRSRSVCCINAREYDA